MVLLHLEKVLLTCFAYTVVFCVPPLSIKYFTVFQEVEMDRENTE